MKLAPLMSCNANLLFTIEMVDGKNKQKKKNNNELN